MVINLSCINVLPTIRIIDSAHAGEWDSVLLDLKITKHCTYRQRPHRLRCAKKILVI